MADRAAGDPFEAALRYLERRARTVEEVRKRLSGRGYGAREVSAVIGELRRLGYLDDAAYAARLVARAAADRPMGRGRLSQELLRRGLDRDTIEQALERSFGPDEEEAALQRALRKAVRTMRGSADRAARRKVAAYLLRRGFRRGQVMGAVKAWSRGLEAEGRRAGTEEAGEFEE